MSLHNEAPDIAQRILYVSYLDLFRHASRFPHNHSSARMRHVNHLMATQGLDNRCLFPPRGSAQVSADVDSSDDAPGICPPLVMLFRAPSSVRRRPPVLGTLKLSGTCCMLLAAEESYRYKKWVPKYPKQTHVNDHPSESPQAPVSILPPCPSTGGSVHGRVKRAVRHLTYSQSSS